MAAATITAAPTIKASNLTVPSREGGTWTASWKIPAEASKESNAKRWQNVIVLWTVTYNVKKNGEWVTERIFRKLAAGTTTNSLAINPATSLWPATGGADKQVRSVSVRIRGWNSKGYGPNVDATLTMAVPVKPSLSLSYDAETGRVSATVKASNVKGPRHRYDTQLWVSRAGVGGTQTLTDASASTSTSRTVAHNIAEASSLAAGKCIKVTATARNRGMRGNGASATTYYIIAHPNRPTCGTPSLSYATKGVLSTASVIVPISNQGFVTLKSGSKVYPAQLKLQRLRNSDSTTPEDAAAESGWADVDGAVDDGRCSGLVDAWADAVSADGQRTWYRVAAIRDGYTQYGPPVFAKCIYTAAPTVTAGTASISSLKSNAAGTAAIVSWARSGYSNGGGIEISWSDYAGAWSSTSGPSTYEQATDAASGSRNIDSLTAGTTYYVRVRPYATNADGSKKWGKYSSALSVTVEASTGTASITSIEPTSDRAGAKLVMAKAQASDAIEISWSERYAAWTSNDAPDTTVTSTGGTTKTWYVYGLDEGVRYYFRVRPVDGTTFGTYSGRTAFTIAPRSATVGRASITSATSGDDGETVVVRASVTTAFFLTFITETP